jgi:uncharacterized membrane protein
VRFDTGANMELIYHGKHNQNISGAERVASVIAGGLLAYTGMKRKSVAGYALAAIGGDLVRRGATGHSFIYEALGVRTAKRGQGANVSVPYELGVRVDKTVTVNRPRPEVYAFWRKLENLPRFMEHLESVKVMDDKRSHWCVKGSAAKSYGWDAEIVMERENELISWRSLEGAEVNNAGSVQFRDAPGGRGTEVKVELQYDPPAGAVGALLAKLFGKEPGDQIEEDLRRFKSIMETGEVAKTQGQPVTKPEKQSSDAAGKHGQHDAVRKASEESFPASDAPAWSHSH